jgi:hypothetical protein
LVLRVGDKVGSDTISCTPAEEVYPIVATMSAVEQKEEVAGPEVVSTFPVDVEGKPGEVNLEDIGESTGEAEGAFNYDEQLGHVNQTVDESDLPEYIEAA